MSEFFERYYPTICVRRAEMKALEKLPTSEKQIMLPIVLLAPWLNSIKFDNTFGIIEKSIGDTKIIVDLDRHFRSDSGLPSRKFFRKLLDGDSGAREWISLWQQRPNYIPCILFEGVSDELVNAQIAAARALGRGFAFRIELQSKPDLKRVFSQISECRDDDIITIFDYGYDNDSLEIAAMLSNILRNFLEISDELKFVVLGANFPNSFSEFDDFSQSRRIGARLVFRELKQAFGNYQLFYGDWASTKPRRYDGGGSKPLPRIDYPTKSQWIIARSKDEEWTFQDAARRIVRLNEWADKPSVWGAGLIEKTAKGLPGGISTGPQSIAARINIHLYHQNHFSVDGALPVPEGEWIDPI